MNIRATIHQTKFEEEVDEGTDRCIRLATKFVVSMNLSTQFTIQCSAEDPSLLPGEVTQKSKHSSVSC
jgi:hypothetical protein